MGALSASTSTVNWLVEDDILLKNAVEVTLRPVPPIVVGEFLLSVSVRQLKLRIVALAVLSVDSLDGVHMFLGLTR
jgi:hypothetical protein